MVEIITVDSVERSESMQANPLHPKAVKKPIKFLKLIKLKVIIGSAVSVDSDVLVGSDFGSLFLKDKTSWIRKIIDAGIVIIQ